MKLKYVLSIALIYSISYGADISHTGRYIDGIPVKATVACMQQLGLIQTAETINDEQNPYKDWLQAAYTMVHNNANEFNILTYLCTTPRTVFSNYASTQQNMDHHVHVLSPATTITGSEYCIPVLNAAGKKCAQIYVSRLQTRLRSLYATETGCDPYKPAFAQTDFSTFSPYIRTFQHVSEAVYARLLHQSDACAIKTLPKFLIPLQLIATRTLPKLSDEHYVTVQPVVENLVPLHSYPQRSDVVKQWNKEKLRQIKHEIEQGILWDIASQLLINPATSELYYGYHRQPNNSVGVMPDGTDFFFYQDHPEKHASSHNLSYLTGNTKYQHDVGTGVGHYSEADGGNWWGTEGFVTLLAGCREQEKMWKEITGIVNNNF